VSKLFTMLMSYFPYKRLLAVLLPIWLGLPRWASHPLDSTVLPGRFQNRTPGTIFD
jgi:hypothetical protein